MLICEEFYFFFQMKCVATIIFLKKTSEPMTYSTIFLIGHPKLKKKNKNVWKIDNNVEYVMNFI